MEFDSVVRKRRMVRRFEPRPIPDDVLDRVLEAARHSPSAGFSQGFDFVILNTPQDLAWFFRTTDDPTDPDPYPGREPETAPVCIVLPFANKHAYLDRYAMPDKIAFGMDREENWPVPFWTVDTSMAVLLILLGAVNEGLGAWYFGITRGEKELVDTLGVPATSELLGVIALGYPAADDRPVGSILSRRRRPFAEMFHFGRWQSRRA